MTDAERFEMLVDQFCAVLAAVEQHNTVIGINGIDFKVENDTKEDKEWLTSEIQHRWNW